MSLIVQTNPPIDTANAYTDLVGFKAYHDLRLQDYTAFTDAQVTASLIEGSSYLDMRFAYNGWRASVTQPGEWPRNGLFDDRGNYVSGVPDRVVWASCEYALRWLRQGFTLMPDPTVDETGRPVTSVEEVVGPVKTRKTFSVGQGYALPNYPYPDHLLRSRGYVSSAATGSIASNMSFRS